MAINLDSEWYRRFSKNGSATSRREAGGMSSLVKYDAACRALAEAKAVDEVKDILDVVRLSAITTRPGDVRATRKNWPGCPAVKKLASEKIGGDDERTSQQRTSTGSFFPYAGRGVGSAFAVGPAVSAPRPAASPATAARQRPHRGVNRIRKPQREQEEMPAAIGFLCMQCALCYRNCYHSRRVLTAITAETAPVAAADRG